MSGCIGIIGGTGLYSMEGLEGLRWQRITTSFGDPSDDLLIGTYRDRRVIFLPRHGRGHRLLPSELNHRANIMAMKELGVRWIISVSAVGSLQPRYNPCDIVVIDQFLDRTKKSAEHTYFGRGIAAHVSMAHPLCPELRQIALVAARRLDVPVHDGGTYINMEGPAFSTRAESLQNNRDGHAVIGMTNLGEARCAREAEIAYATLAMVTDFDCWRPHDPHVTVETVIEHLRRNARTAQDILGEIVTRIDPQARCTCHRALEGAILTDRQAWPEETVTAIRPILSRHLA